MSERPIIFNTPMIKAILARNKSLTRIAIKGQQSSWDKIDPELDVKGKEFFFVLGKKDGKNLRPILDVISCPYGQVGDQLWVKEDWKASAGWDRTKPSEIVQNSPILGVASENGK